MLPERYGKGFVTTQSWALAGCLLLALFIEGCSPKKPSKYEVRMSKVVDAATASLNGTNPGAMISGTSLLAFEDAHHAYLYIVAVHHDPGSKPDGKVTNYIVRRFKNSEGNDYFHAEKMTPTTAAMTSSVLTRRIAPPPEPEPEPD